MSALTLLCFHLTKYTRSQMELEDMTLLLYMTLVQNDGFRGFVLSRTDPESLVSTRTSSLFRKLGLTAITDVAIAEATVRTWRI